MIEPLCTVWVSVDIGGGALDIGVVVFVECFGFLTTCIRLVGGVGEGMVGVIVMFPSLSSLAPLNVHSV